MGGKSPHFIFLEGSIPLRRPLGRAPLGRCLWDECRRDDMPLRRRPIRRQPLVQSEIWGDDNRLLRVRCEEMTTAYWEWDVRRRQPLIENEMWGNNNPLLRVRYEDTTTAYWKWDVKRRQPLIESEMWGDDNRLLKVKCEKTTIAFCYQSCECFALILKHSGNMTFCFVLFACLFACWLTYSFFGILNADERDTYFDDLLK